MRMGERRRRFVVLTLVLGVLMAACAGGAQGDGPALAAAAAPRLDGDVATIPEVVDSATAFATDLYRELARGEGNLVFSPYSVLIALAMTRAGAAGVTADELDSVLHLEDIADPHPGFNALDQELKRRHGTFTRADRTEAELELRIANALWGQRNIEFDASFLELLAEQYGAGMRLVDYVSDAGTARIEINDWVADQTANKIEDLVPEGALDATTRLVLTNAIYLLAPWEWPFAGGATAQVPFHRIDGTETPIDLMRLFSTLGYAQGDGWQAVELPYAGRQIAMTVIVPDSGTFAEFEAKVDGDVLATVTDGLSARRVALRFPKFELRTQASLTSALRALGLVDGLASDKADFSGMTTKEKLSITDVIHEAFIAVDEEGTEATAATALGLMTVSAGPIDQVQLVVDRPFVFLIRDTETGAILFLGRVLDPSE